MRHLGLDIGGTKIAAAVLTGDGTTLYQQRTATRKASYEHFLQHVCRIVTAIQDQVGAPLSIGIALPGNISPLSGLIKNSNILPLNGRPLQQDLQQRLNQRVAIGNDANCFALSEAMDGAGKTHRMVFGVTLGTGCGGGLAIDKQVIAGGHGNAAECGHNPLPGYDPAKDGPAANCYCGQRNCVESFVSGTGLANRYLLVTGRRATAWEIMTQAENGEAAAAYQCDLFLDQLARMLATIVNLIDPDVIVLGGGLSNAPALYRDMASRVAAYTFTDRFCTPIVQAIHGDSSGVRGAAWMGKEEPGR
ncbi:MULTISPECIES: ROK family protein [unclassified Brenneria]|uniref:ROK family protein n=1 Tax=unclassified Brenneria TaxID=2634434 RepID=UPI0018F0839E|nr:ROK family protein [Brenneria sp. L3-3C-1]MBJ7221420.1 ROK family protein [Brenneria sp. L3-3C-1]MEE3642664.1 ROK family protein [Brenneria sp. L3_3C_1]